jgi:predicted transcriptional regulator
MSVMTHRTTFALDEATADRLKRLAKAWSVSQAEVVRRAVELAEKGELASGGDPLDRLRAYHSAGGLDEARAEAWLAEVAESRQEWGREP